MPSDKNEIQEKLRLLRDVYAQQLPDKIKEIKNYWEIWVTGGDGEDLILLHRLLHGIAGSGATFGFEELGRLARQIEQILKLWMTGDAAQSTEAKDEVAELLNALPALTGTSNNTVLEEEVLPVQVSQAIEDDEDILIYILDNNAKLAEELGEQLETYGYQTQIYTSSSDLADGLDKALPAVVVVDTHVLGSELEGMNFIKQYKEDHLPGFSIVFISEVDSFDMRLNAVRVGGEAYFTKPVNIDQLVDRLDSMTKRDAPDPYRILIVDDDPALASYYKNVLIHAGMSVCVINNPESIFESMAKFDPEMILMDIYMPICSGLELARLVRQQDIYISVPIVYLSTENDNRKQMDALNSGGDDFLTKPISDSDLVSAVIVRVKRARRLCDLMSQDSLTGLLKHTKIKAQLANELSRAIRRNARMAFIMIDIDHFKHVNDNYGHMAGDHVIKSLSRLLQQRMRKSDSIGRYGGEEFAVVLPDAGIDDANRVIEMIRERFSNISFVHEGKEFQVTLSAGVSGFPAYNNAEEIIKSADKALYMAKEDGRNRIALVSKD